MQIYGDFLLMVVITTWATFQTDPETVRILIPAAAGVIGAAITGTVSWLVHRSKARQESASAEETLREGTWKRANEMQDDLLEQVRSARLEASELRQKFSDKEREAWDLSQQVQKITAESNSKDLLLTDRDREVKELQEVLEIARKREDMHKAEAEAASQRVSVMMADFVRREAETKARYEKRITELEAEVRSLKSYPTPPKSKM
jgi:chromosome segregation ATPase